MQGEKRIMTHYFGVRHHSPACAYYAEEFLRHTQPEVLLIEGPSDLSGLIPQLCAPEVKLPGAILAYTEEAPVHTVLYPFAEFSPEYAAMMWAVRNGVEVRFCGDCVPLRNSRDPDGPVLVFSAPEWDAFVEGVKLGEFDRPGP